MNKTQAIKEITAVFSVYGATPPPPTISEGKAYELFCLAGLIDDLSKSGFQIRYKQNTTPIFKAGPGYLDFADPHFDIEVSGTLEGHIFLNVEMHGIGSSHSPPPADLSAYHELDIIIVEPPPPNRRRYRPDRKEVMLGAECKSAASFTKALVREALGVRREFSFLALPRKSKLNKLSVAWQCDVAADNLAEHRLYFVDPHGKEYEKSPAHFSVKLIHLEP